MFRTLLAVGVVASCQLVAVKSALAQGGDVPTPDQLEAVSASDDSEPRARDALAGDAGDPGQPLARRAPNSVYLEGLGAGLAYSLNYERLVLEDVGVRVGAGYMQAAATAGSASASSSLLTIPITLSYLGIGSQHHMLEIGGGATLLHTSGAASSVGVSASGSATTAFPELMLGYRLHPVDGAGFQLRVGAMMFVGKGLGFSDADPNKVGVLPWLYLSLGAAF